MTNNGLFQPKVTILSVCYLEPQFFCYANNCFDVSQLMRNGSSRDPKLTYKFFDATGAFGPKQPMKVSHFFLYLYNLFKIINFLRNNHFKLDHYTLLPLLPMFKESFFVLIQSMSPITPKTLENTTNIEPAAQLITAIKNPSHF